VAFALWVVALLVFVPSLEGPFLFDDIIIIEGNHYVHSFSHWMRWWTGHLWDTNYDTSPAANASVFWRPLVQASFAWDWTLGGGAPMAFHLTNFALHALNTVLVWGLFRTWFANQALALGLTLLFAFHPANSEVVCWLSGRGDSLCCVGLLLTAFGTRRIRRGQTVTGIALGLFGATVALLAKEAGVLLPAMVALELFASERSKQSRGPLANPSRRAWLILAASVLVVVVYAGVRSELMQRSLLSHLSVAPSRWAFIFEALGRGLSLIVWPLDTTLGRGAIRSLDGVLMPRYDYAAVGAIGFVLVSWTAWYLRRRKPALAVAWLCFLAFWFPVSGVLFHGEPVLVSPRYLYIPLIAALYLCGVAVQPLLEDSRLRRAGRIVCLLLIPSYFALSFVRAGDYSSEGRFWRAEISSNPNYVPAQVYFVLRETRANRPASALRLILPFLASNRAKNFEGSNTELRFYALKAASTLTKDIDQTTLTYLANFCDGVAQGHIAPLEVPSLGIHIELGHGPQVLGEWGVLLNRLLMQSAELWSRLGEDRKALARVQLALAQCSECWTLMGRAGLLRARAGDLAGAEELAHAFKKYAGPTKGDSLATVLHAAFDAGPLVFAPNPPSVLVANYYLSLEAYGRAFAAAKGAFANPPADPEAHKMLAELALRAGDADAARKMLAYSMSAAQIQAWESEALKDAPWHDSEIPPGTWIPTVD